MTRKSLILLSLCLSFLLLPTLTVRAQDTKAIDEEMMMAARKGNHVAVRTLLAKGANVNAKFRYDATALSHASDKGHTEVVKVLLEHGADVNVKDTFYKETPLGWAAYKGHAEIVSLLLDKGAEGKDGALMTGAQSGRIEIVKAVLDKGGVSAETLTNALASAMKANHTEIVELLKKAGAVPPPKADFQVDAETLNSYAGVYKNPEGMEFTFTVKEGKLFAAPSGQTPLELGAIDKITFKPLAFEGVTATFTIEGGKVTGFTLKQGGTNNQLFKRMATN
ncbi:MAG: ankyrin repeat domain-containing protein [Pyrinomonadaceae bacterium MAG19_C2-C3]|nr:ankyrin repeat domain-containing protein [Pyrinomonadaceae bacterium MAG19_C2-C3]